MNNFNLKICLNFFLLSFIYKVNLFLTRIGKNSYFQILK